MIDNAALQVVHLLRYNVYSSSGLYTEPSIQKKITKMTMSKRTLQAIVRNTSSTPLAFPVVQKRFAATVLQKPKIVDLSRELYHRCPNHPFHVPFVS